MANKRYYWIKLNENFFNTVLVKQLRKLPDGDKVVIIYLKLLLSSSNNGGVIRSNNVLPVLEDEIALSLDEDEATVRMAISALEKYKVIERLEEDAIFLIAHDEMVGSETAGAQRVRDFRERKALQSNNSVTSMKRDETKCCVEKSRVDKEKERELELEVDGRRTDKKESTQNQATIPSTETEETHPHSKEPVYKSDLESFLEDAEIIDTIKERYNTICNGIFKHQQRTFNNHLESVKESLGKGLTIEHYEKAFQIAIKSQFMRGGNKQRWVANFGWLIQYENILKVLNGDYSDESDQSQSSAISKAKPSKCEELEETKEQEEYISESPFEWNEEEVIDFSNPEKYKHLL